MILEIIIVLVLLLILLKYYNIISYKIYMTSLIILLILNVLLTFEFDKWFDFVKIGIWGGVGWLLVEIIFILRKKFVIGEKAGDILCFILFIVWILFTPLLVIK